MGIIRVFHSHIEVYPYTKGQCPIIESMSSKYEHVTHKRIPMGMYIQNDILYLPRGFTLSLLEKALHYEVETVTDCDPYARIKKGVGKFKPKSKIQENAINFLCGNDIYSYTSQYSQLGLNLDTGDGKTYSAIYSILKYKIKAMVITHQEKLKQQWYKSFAEMTTFPIENICNISGTEVIDQLLKGEITAEIYLVNHQTLATYAKVYGWTRIRDLFKKLKIGIKVIDESHKFFENTFLIDCFSNCYKTFYLTATYGRTDPAEIRIYKRAFSSLVRFGEETVNYTEKRKHIHFIPCFFKSEPWYSVVPDVRTTYGFSAYKYIRYELDKSLNPSQNLVKVLCKILDEIKNMEGKILIISPMKESVDMIADIVRNYIQDKPEYAGKEVGCVYSNNSNKVNKENLQKDIISSTIKSVGEGVDIKGLRVLIDLEPVGSKTLADQVRGRLREYSEDKDTYFFYPVDTTINESEAMLKRIMPIMKKKCKDIRMITMNAI